MYPLLILTLFLVVQILMMLEARKNVLDKARTELADSVNKSNMIYSNEELSTLLDEQKKISEQLQEQLNGLKNNQDKLVINNGYYETKGQLKVKKMTFGEYYSNNTNKYIKIKLGNLKINSYSMVLVTLKIYEYSYFNTINVASYLYGSEGVYKPGVSYLNKKYAFDIFWGVNKNTNDVYVIIDCLTAPYIAIYIDEISISHNATYNLDSGWNISGTNNLDDMTLYKCTVL